MTTSRKRTLQGYPIRELRIPVTGKTYDIIGPKEYETLLDDPRVEARFAHDEYMPYWAEFWPAAILLAEAVAAWEPGSGSVHVLELGCGLGLISLLARELGYSVTASDYDEDALAFVAENCKRNGLPAPALRYIDWRETYPDLKPDRIIAAEVLYEERNLRPVASFIRTHLVRDGFALLCDRNRPTADGFPDVAAAAGLLVETQAAECCGPDGERVTGRLFRVTKTEGDHDAQRNE